MAGMEAGEGARLKRRRAALLRRLWGREVERLVAAGSPRLQAEEQTAVTVYGGDTRFAVGAADYPDSTAYLLPEALAIWSEDPVFRDLHGPHQHREFWLQLRRC